MIARQSSAVAVVPKGHPIIAPCFSTGSRPHLSKVPEGRQNSVKSVRPCPHSAQIHAQKEKKCKTNPNCKMHKTLPINEKPKNFIICPKKTNPILHLRPLCVLNEYSTFWKPTEAYGRPPGGGHTAKLPLILIAMNELRIL